MKWQKVLTLVIIILAVVSASLYGAMIPINWQGFGVSSLVLLVAIIFQRKSLKKEIQEGKEGKYSLQSFLEFTNKLESNLRQILNKNFPITNSQIEKILEKETEKISLEMDSFKNKIVEEIGVGKFTEIMTTFAKAERKLNRAYSALIDGYKEETLSDVEESIRLIDETRKIIEKYITK